MRLPPSFLMTSMVYRLPEPLSLSMASAASLEKWYLWWVSSLEDRVVLAMFSTSSWNFSSSSLEGGGRGKGRRIREEEEREEERKRDHQNDLVPLLWRGIFPSFLSFR